RDSLRGRRLQEVAGRLLVLGLEDNRGIGAEVQVARSSGPPDSSRMTRSPAVTEALFSSDSRSPQTSPGKPVSSTTRSTLFSRAKSNTSWQNSVLDTS